MSGSVPRSLLSPRVDLQLRSLERSRTSDRDPIATLRETVQAIWTIVASATSEMSLHGSPDGDGAVLARRELVQRGTCALSTVIRRGVASGAFRPRCPSWAIRRLPFALVAGACVHWMIGLAMGPSLRANIAVAAALDVLRPVKGLRTGCDFTYEPGVIIVEGDLVTAHGRYSADGRTFIAADIFRFEGDFIAQHWDVLQEEVATDKTGTGLMAVTGRRNVRDAASADGSAIADLSASSLKPTFHHGSA